MATARMPSALGKMTEDPDRYIHLLASFKATVRGRQASVSALHLQGPLSDQIAERFVRRWGRRYFEEAAE